jgi:hypothetical protein
MNALLKRLSTTNNSPVASTSNHSVQTRCNYADNYYGDQVCVEVKKNQSRINIHVGVQM